MVLGTTFKDVVPISSFISYVKHHSYDEIICDWVNGVTSVKLCTNGEPEDIGYKALVIQTEPIAQDEWGITFDHEYEANILHYLHEAHGYVWNVTRNEVVRARSADLESGKVSLVRHLFNTNMSTWGRSDVLLFLNVIVLGPVTITSEGEWVVTLTTNPEAGDILNFTYGGRTTKYQFVTANPNLNDIMIGDTVSATAENLAEILDRDYADYTTSIVSNMGGQITIIQGDYAGYILGNVSIEGVGAVSVVTNVEPEYTGSLGCGIGAFDKIPDIGIGQKLFSP